MSMQAIPIEMPQLSSEGEAATLASWLVAVGDRVEKGDVIAELETDKATVELESPASGTVVEFLVSAGSEGILPGVTLGRIAPGEDAPQQAAPRERTQPAPDSESPVASASGREVSPADRPEPAAESVPGPTAAEEGVGLRGSTPLARRAAAHHQVDLSTVAGSGPGGRVVEADVLQLRESAPESQAAATAAGTIAATAAGGGVGSPARATAPIAAAGSVLQLGIRCPMDTALAALARLERAGAKPGNEPSIGLIDLVLRAVALALRAVPEANVGWAGDRLQVFDRVDLSVSVGNSVGNSVATSVEVESASIGAVLRGADRMGLATVSAERRALAAPARDGALGPDQLEGGSFRVCDLGGYGVGTVAPSVNSPQTCVLGVGAVEERPVVRDGQVAVGRVAALVLVADPRALTETVAARLLAAVRERLEDPLGMML